MIYELSQAQMWVIVLGPVIGVALIIWWVER